MTTEKKVENEKKRLHAIFSDIEIKKKSTVEKLIDNAAFMSVLLDELSSAINENGYVSKYQNGANQWGTKKSPEVEVYIATISNYSKIVKQLTDLLPDEVKSQVKDEIREFLK